MTTHLTKSGSHDAQAKRLERVYEEVAKLLREPGVVARLRTPPGENEWSAMQTLGHMTEMIPYWLNHCRTLIAAMGTPPTFGRTPGSPERLAGVARPVSAVRCSPRQHGEVSPRQMAIIGPPPCGSARG